MPRAFAAFAAPTGAVRERPLTPRTTLRSALISLAVVAGLLLAADLYAQGLDSVTANGRLLSESFTRSTLTIRTAAPREVRLDVFLALDPAQRARGLMFVEALPDDAGMLFVHEREQVVLMWMKNTPLPLDMLFLERGGRIVTIAKGATPYSLGSISSMRPAIAVLEINAGLVDRLGIQVGDRVEHELLAGGR